MTTRTEDLAGVLESLGVDVHRMRGDEINGKCPVHYKVKGRESTRNSWYMNVDSGLWHCFTCGARGNLSMLVSELSDDPSMLWSVQHIIIEQGLRRLTEDEKEYIIPEPEVDWVTFARFAPLSEAILNLKSLDAGVAKRFGLCWDPEKKCYITPIVSPLGELRGWQAKKKKWVENTPTGVQKHTTLFGIERAFASTALLVESPMDVVRFHSVVEDSDVNCVSSFGANVSDEQVRLLTQRFDKLILAMDNDTAGRNETKRLNAVLPSFRNGIRFWNYTPTDPKDIGEMTDHQIVTGLGNVSRVLNVQG